MSRDKELLDVNALLPVFFFGVTFLDGADKMDYSFTSVRGLEKELQFEEISEGGVNNFSYRLPKPAKSKNLVLKRALRPVGKDDGLTQWVKAAVDDFSFRKKTIQVSLLKIDEKAEDGQKEGIPVKTWEFYDAYPVKYSLTDFDAEKNELVFETLEFAYSFFKET